MRVLIAGHSRAILEQCVAALAGVAGIHCTSRLLGNGHGDTLYEATARPDVLVLHVDGEHRRELEALAAADPATRPPLLVVGEREDSELMRLAIRCGARDFLPQPVSAADFDAAFERIRQQHRHGPASRGRMTVLVGAAGGVGTSFLAANLAHRYATDGERTVLVDLDLVCAPLLPLFDLDPPLGLLDALAGLDGLDAQALEGYVGRHHSGLAVLGATGDGVALDDEVAGDRLVALLQRISESAAHVVIDAGSRLTPLTLAAAGLADQLVLVTQQSVACVRNAVRLKRAFERARAGKPLPLVVVVNRHQRASAVTADDIRKALDCTEPLLVPNDYRIAHESCDSGVPLIEVAGHAPLTRAIASLAATLAGRGPRAPRSLLERALPMFSRRSS